MVLLGSSAGASWSSIKACCSLQGVAGNPGTTPNRTPAKGQAGEHWEPLGAGGFLSAASGARGRLARGAGLRGEVVDDLCCGADVGDAGDARARVARSPRGWGARAGVLDYAERQRDGQGEGDGAADCGDRFGVPQAAPSPSAMARGAPASAA